MPHGALTIKDSRNLFMKEDDEKGSRKNSLIIKITIPKTSI